MGTFLIDMPSRELVGNFIIFEKLRRLSSQCTIVMDEQDHFFGKHGTNLFHRFKRDSDFIFTPSYNVRRTPSIRVRSALSGIPLIVYHSEQFFQNYYDKEKLNSEHAKTFAEVVDLHLVWGEFFRDKLIRIGVPEDRIAVVGSIKSEVVLLKQAGLESRRQPTPGRERDHDFLLLSSFSIADMSDPEWAIFQKQFGLDDSIDERVNARACRLGMIAFARDLAAQHPDKTLLVRRHPGEPEAIYADKLGDVANIRLSEMKEISEDILRSSLVILQDSTAVFEVEASRTPWISVDFAPSDELYRCEPREAFPRHAPDLVLAHLARGDIELFLGSDVMRRRGAGYFVGPTDTAVSDRIATAVHACLGRRPRRWTSRDLIDGMKLFAKHIVAAAAFGGPWRWLPGMQSIRARLQSNSTLWALGEHQFDAAALDNAHREALRLLGLS